MKIRLLVIPLQTAMAFSLHLRLSTRALASQNLSIFRVIAAILDTREEAIL